MTAEGRARAKQRRHELSLQREREQQLEEDRRLYVSLPLHMQL